MVAGGKIGKVDKPSQARVLRHAHKISRAGDFLELPDLLLFALWSGVDLDLMLNSGEGEIPSMPVYTYVKDNLPAWDETEIDQLLSLARQGSHASGERWSILLTTPSYKASDDIPSMAHWVPCWQETKFNEFNHYDAAWKAEQSRVDSDLDSLLKDTDQMQDFDEYILKRTSLDNFKLLLKRLHSQHPKMVARNVPGDGNCGVWSLMCLRQFPSCGMRAATTVDHWQGEEMMQLRAELASMWSGLSDQKLVQKFQFDMFPGAVLLTDVKAESEVDGIAPTTPSKNDTNEKKCLNTQGSKTDKTEALLNMPTPEKVSHKERMCQAAGLVKKRDEVRRDFAESCSTALVSVQSMESAKRKPEKEELDDVKNPPLKKGRRRRARTDEELRILATKTYLGSKMIVWGTFQKVHYQLAPSTKAFECGVGGFPALQKLLAGGEMPKTMAQRSSVSKPFRLCDACVHLLDVCKFSMTELQDAIDRAENKVEDVVGQQAPGGNEDGQDLPGSDVVAAHELTANEIQNMIKPEQKSDQEEQDDQEMKEEPAEGSFGASPVGKMIADMPSVFLRLPPGTEKKRFPIVCLLCSKSSGKRRVFDAVTMNKTQYVNQHVKSATHCSNVAVMEKRRESKNSENQMTQTLGSKGRRVFGMEMSVLPALASGSSGRELPKDPNDPNAPKDPDDPNAEEHVVACCGFSVDAFPRSRLSQLHSEFDWYLDHTIVTAGVGAGPNGKRFGRNMSNSQMNDPNGQDADIAATHRYIREVGTGKCTVFHRNCHKTVSDSLLSSQGNVCPACTSLSTDKSLVRNVGRFWVKYMSAMLLKAKLFHPEAEEELEAHISDSLLIRLVQAVKTEMKLVRQLNLSQLQRYVRGSFMSIPVFRQTPALQFMIGSLVWPSVSVNLQSCTSDAAKRAAFLASRIAKGTFADVSDLDLKLGCSIAAGGLRSHPLLHGILIMFTEKIRREEKGVFSFKGLNLSEEEKVIVAESGACLAAACGNKNLRIYSKNSEC